MDAKVKKYREYFNSLLLKSILVYLLINIVAIIVFWTTRPVYGSNYVIYIFYIILPVSGFIIAILNSIRGFNLASNYSSNGTFALWNLYNTQ